MNLQSELTERLEDVQNDLKLSLERNERLSAQVKKLEEDSASREKLLNGKVSSYKNEIQGQGAKSIGLNNKLRLPWRFRQKKQASEDAIKALEEKLNMANNMLEQRKSIIKLEGTDKKQATLGLVDGGIDVEQKTCRCEKRA